MIPLWVQMILYEKHPDSANRSPENRKKLERVQWRYLKTPFPLILTKINLVHYTQLN